MNWVFDTLTIFFTLKKWLKVAVFEVRFFWGEVKVGKWCQIEKIIYETHLKSIILDKLSLYHMGIRPIFHEIGQIPNRPPHPAQSFLRAFTIQCVLQRFFFSPGYRGITFSPAIPRWTFSGKGTCQNFQKIFSPVIPRWKKKRCII